jgi:hypothetical protein
MGSSLGNHSCLEGVDLESWSAQLYRGESWHLCRFVLIVVILGNISHPRQVIEMISVTKKILQLLIAGYKLTEFQM